MNLLAKASFTHLALAHHIIPILSTSTAKNQFRTTNLPTDNVSYRVGYVTDSQLSDIRLPLAELEDWVSATTAWGLGLHVSMYNDVTGASIDRNTIFIKRCRLSAVLYFACTSASALVLGNITVRLYNTLSKTSDTTTFNMDSTGYAENREVFKNSKDLSGMAYTTQTTLQTTGGEPFLDGCKLTTLPNKAVSQYDNVVVSRVTLSSETLPVYNTATKAKVVLVLPNTGYYFVKQLCEFHVSSSIGGYVIPFKHITQLTPNTFAVDKDFIDDRFADIGDGKLTVLVVSHIESCSSPIYSKEYDNEWVHVLDSMNTSTRVGQLIGNSIHGIQGWLARTLEDSPITTILNTTGVVQRNLVDLPVNIFYGDSVLPNRFDLIAGMSQVLTASETVGTGIIYSPIDDNNANTEYVGDEIYLDSFFKTHGQLIDLQMREFKLYRHEEIHNSDVSLGGILIHPDKFTPVEVSVIGDIIDGVSPKLQITDLSGEEYLITYDRGHHCEIIDIDNELDNCSPIIVHKDMDCTIIVKLNGHELIKGLEYVEHLCMDGEAYYTTEIYLTCGSYLLETGNILEVHYIRGFTTTMDSGLLQSTDRYIDGSMPKVCTQLTLAGNSIRDELTEEGMITSTEYGAVWQARCMVPSEVDAVNIPLAIVEIRNTLTPGNVANGYTVNSVDLQPVVINFGDQAVIHRLMMEYLSGNLVTLSDEEVLGIMDGLAHYREVDVIRKQHVASDYARIVRCSVPFEDLPPLVISSLA